jgi:serine protease AprX
MRNHVTRGAKTLASALSAARVGSRGRALARSGRTIASVVLALVIVLGALAPTAGARPPGARGKNGDPYRAFVTPPLLEAARANRQQTFAVIVQGTGKNDSRALSRKTRHLFEGAGYRPRVGLTFDLISGVSVQLTGAQILKLARKSYVSAITPDARVGLSAYSNPQKWAYVAGVARLWRDRGGLNAPAIAVVDSGIDRNRADFGFGSQIREEVVMTTLPGNASADGRGHGTFVAGIAAGQAPGYAGALPAAPIVSIDVMDDKGMARTSEVIAAAEWIYENRQRLNIRVANFSLHSSVPNSFMYDPLDKAVEKLWFGGVVVVAAAGNYGVNGQPSDMPFAPGNDPFVITVGANDIGGSIGLGDDAAAPWSAYGYTLDGFSKPEIGAPGRYMIGPVPPNATLPRERPGQVRGEGYMELSGTSFAAPLVSGIAAYLLAVHPEWTPDHVKGALMLTAKPLPSARPGSLGVGEVNGPRAADLLSPPNPNAALNQFLVRDPNGGASPVFDAASWARVATEDASWARVSYEDTAWNSASWARDYWESASWARNAFESASWASSAQAAASWAAASWASVSYEDGADSDPGVGGEIASPEEQAAAEEELGIADSKLVATP